MFLQAQDYPAAIRDLLSLERLPELGPGQQNLAVKQQLQRLTVEDLAGGNRISNREAAECCLSGLWLRHDFLQESHALSQDIATRDGSYWHGIMHRREPDYGNAKYWFRRVGDHPVFAELGPAAAELAQGQSLAGTAKFLASGKWDPYQFIFMCEAVAAGQTAYGQLARQIAKAEWELLFADCWRRAFT